MSDFRGQVKLESIDIGAWRSYQAYTNKQQIALQRQALEFTGLCNAQGEVSFIFTRYADELNSRLCELADSIRIENTETVIEDEIYFTSKIEGAKTTRKRTAELHSGMPVSKENEFSDRMVKNGFEAVKLLNLYGDKMSTDILIKVWEVLAEGACDNTDIKGNGNDLPFRTGEVGVGTYTGAPFTEVESLMIKWVEFYNSPNYELYPFIKAILLHYAFESIHPFCDGNGRMGRLLINNYLIHRGIESARAVSFSMQIDARRSAYDAAFVDSENLYNDCTPLVEYMLEIMNSAYDTALGVQNNTNRDELQRDI